MQFPRLPRLPSTSKLFAVAAVIAAFGAIPANELSENLRSYWDIAGGETAVAYLTSPAFVEGFKLVLGAAIGIALGRLLIWLKRLAIAKFAVLKARFWIWLGIRISQTEPIQSRLCALEQQISESRSQASELANLYSDALIFDNLIEKGRRLKSQVDIHHPGPIGLGEILGLQTWHSIVKKEIKLREGGAWSWKRRDENLQKLWRSKFDSELSTSPSSGTEYHFLIDSVIDAIRSFQSEL